MKKLAIIASILIACVGLISCNDNKNEATPEPSEINKAVAGVWHLTAFAGEAPADNGVDIYIKLSKEGKFVSYQKGINNMRYVKLDGEFLIAENGGEYVFSGKYADSTPTKTYKLALNADKSQLTLTNAELAADVTVYAREEYIPAAVLANIAPDSRAEGEAFEPLF